MEQQKEPRSRAQKAFLILFIISTPITLCLIVFFILSSGRPQMSQMVSVNTPTPLAQSAFTTATPEALPLATQASGLPGTAAPLATAVYLETPSMEIPLPQAAPYRPSLQERLLPIAVYSSLITSTISFIGFIQTTFFNSRRKSRYRRTGHGTSKAKPKQGSRTGCVLISYRRSDSADIAGRIYDQLVEAFEEERIFKDVDSIPLGVDFREYLDKKVGESSVFLAIIGDTWLSTLDEEGKRRLDDPDDFVRIEIEAAMKREIPIIPLLVRGATMPEEESLPLSLRKLVYRNGMPVRPDPDFHNDMERLISALEEYVG